MAYQTDLWDSFETVNTRLRDGKKFCEAISKFFDEFSRINKDFAKRLVALCKATEEDFGTVNAAWVAAKTEVENMSSCFIQLADEVVYKAKNPVDLFVKESAKPRKRLTETGRKLIDSFTTHMKALGEARTEYEKAMRTQEQTQSEFERQSQLNELVNTAKLSKKLTADKKKSESTDKKYRKEIEKVVVVETRMYDTEMPRTLAQMEDLERQRIELIKMSLQAFASAGRAFGPSFVSYSDAIHSTSLTIDAAGDVSAFCNEKRSGKTKDNRVVYEPYNPLLQKCSRDGASATPERRSTVSGLVAAPIPATSKPAPTPSMSSSSSMSTIGRSGSGAMPYSSSMSTIGRSGGGTMPPQPQQPQQQPLHSSMNNSQMFAAPMVQQQQPVLYQQQPLYSSQQMPQQSMMPMGVPVVAAAAYQQPAPQQRGGVGLCRGVHDYDAAQPSELTFRQGDIITILEKDRSGWWKGELNGAVGYFPSVEWVEELPMQAVAAAPAAMPIMQQQQPVAMAPAYAPAVRRCRALYQMDAQSPHELTISQGEILTIESEVDGWYYGTNMHGQQGMFPISFVELV